MTEKILFVDDEINVLDAYKRQFRKQFHFDVAEGALKGLDAVNTMGPYAVIVSDMRMPEMDGIQFLAEVKERTPDSVRIMLTGNSDMQTAIDAVNQGNVFRFLTKPCEPELFANTLNAGIEQYKLINAEKELLQKTLTGSVRVLTEVLSIVSPMAFSQSSRIKRYVKHISEELQLHNPWQYELGAMLSQIGYITLPNNVRNKIYSQQPLSEKEQCLFDSHPSIGSKLLENVPRLESIAKMIENQLLPCKDYEASDGSNKHEEVDFGAQILKVAIDFDRLSEGGVSGKDIMSKMRSLPKIYNPKIVETLINLVKSEETKQREDTVKSISVNELEIGMVAEEDVFTSNGAKVLSKGSEITQPALICLSKFAEGVGVEEPFKVRFCYKNE